MDDPIGKEGSMWKFVRVNGEYRWVEVDILSPGHASLVQEGETAEAAGTLYLYPDFWRMTDPYSSTLKIGAKPSHYYEITELLGKPHRSRYDDEMNDAMVNGPPPVK